MKPIIWRTLKFELVKSFEFSLENTRGFVVGQFGPILWWAWRSV